MYKSTLSRNVCSSTSGPSGRAKMEMDFTWLPALATCSGGAVLSRYRSRDGQRHAAWCLCLRVLAS
jgi:hypothetical protein